MRHNLIAYRGKRSQKAMAAKYNVSQQTWSNWENGYDTPRPSRMFQIAKDAKKSMEHLFFDHTDNEKFLQAK